MRQDLCDKIRASIAGHHLLWEADCTITGSVSGRSYVQL